MPPQVNAAITRVTEAAAATGGRDDWDTPGEPADGDEKWAGRVDAYYQEKTDRIADGARLNVFTRRTVYVDTADLDTLRLDTNDVITVELADGQTVTATAQSIAAARLAGIPRHLATSRIELDPA